MPRSNRITKQTTPEEMDRWFRGNLPCGFNHDIDEQLTRDDLLQMMKENKPYLHWMPLLQIIATHPAADDIVFDRMVRLTRDSGVMNAIATSGNASESVLRRLKRSRDASVREHAAIALKKIEMERANDQQWLALFRMHSSDSSFDLAVRSIMPSVPGIPEDILKRLATDDWNHIRAAAKQKLRERRSCKKHQRTAKNASMKKASITRR